MRRIKENTTVCRCIDDTSILQDTVKFFDRKYIKVLYNGECQAHSVATNPMLRGTSFYFSLKNLDVATDRLDPVTGCYRDFVCKFYNKLLSHTYIPHSMLNGDRCPTVKNSSGNKTD